MPFLSYSLSHRVTVSTGFDDNGDFNEEAKRYLRSVQHIDLNAGSYAQEFVQAKKGSNTGGRELGEGADPKKAAAATAEEGEEGTGENADCEFSADSFHELLFLWFCFVDTNARHILCAADSFLTTTGSIISRDSVWQDASTYEPKDKALAVDEIPALETKSNFIMSTDMKRRRAEESLLSNLEDQVEQTRSLGESEKGADAPRELDRGGMEDGVILFPRTQIEKEAIQTPSGIAFDPTGKYIYVADSANGHVNRWKTEDVGMLTPGLKGLERLEMEPAYREQILWTGPTCGTRGYNAKYQLRSKPWRPTSLAFNKAGDLFVLHRRDVENGELSGDYIMRWTSGQLRHELNDKKKYPMAGEVVAMWDSTDEVNKHVKNATAVGQYGGVCECPDGMQYDVGDQYDNCKSLACYGGKAFGCGVRAPQHKGAHMSTTCASNLSMSEIAIDPTDNLYAVNDQTHAVLRWSKDYLESPDVGPNKPHYDVVAGYQQHPGNAVNRLLNPTGIAFDTEGNLLVSDSGNFRVVRFKQKQMKGGHCTSEHSGDCLNPNGGEIIFADAMPIKATKSCPDATANWDMRLIFNGQGDMFALDRCSPRVLRWARSEIHRGPGEAVSGKMPGLPHGVASWAHPPDDVLVSAGGHLAVAFDEDDTKPTSFAFSPTWDLIFGNAKEHSVVYLWNKWDLCPLDVKSLAFNQQAWIFPWKNMSHNEASAVMLIGKTTDVPINIGTTVKIECAPGFMTYRVGKAECFLSRNAVPTLRLGPESTKCVKRHCQVPALTGENQVILAGAAPAATVIARSGQTKPNADVAHGQEVRIACEEGYTMAPKVDEVAVCHSEQGKLMPPLRPTKVQCYKSITCDQTSEQELLCTDSKPPFMNPLPRKLACFRSTSRTPGAQLMTTFKSFRGSSSLSSVPFCDDFTLGGRGAWCFDKPAFSKPEVSPLDIIEVDLGWAHEVLGLVTMGMFRTGRWVSEYKVAFSLDGKIWVKASRPCPANFNDDEQVDTMFEEKVLARYIRITVLKSHRSPALRLGVLHEVRPKAGPVLAFPAFKADTKGGGGDLGEDRTAKESTFEILNVRHPHFQLLGIKSVSGTAVGFQACTNQQSTTPNPTDFKVLKTGNLAVCKEACIADKGCTHITFNKELKLCYTITNCGRLIRATVPPTYNPKRDGETYAVAEVTKYGKKYRQSCSALGYTNRYSMSSEINVASADNAAACKRMCSQLDDCIAASWHKGGPISMKTMWDPPKNRFFSDKLLTGKGSTHKKRPAARRLLDATEPREMGEVHGAGASVAAEGANAAMVNAKLQAKEMDDLTMVLKNEKVTGSDVDKAMKTQWIDMKRGEKHTILNNLLRVRVDGNKAKKLKEKKKADNDEGIRAPIGTEYWEDARQRREMKKETSVDDLLGIAKHNLRAQNEEAARKRYHKMAGKIPVTKAKGNLNEFDIRSMQLHAEKFDEYNLVKQCKKRSFKTRLQGTDKESKTSFSNRGGTNVLRSQCFLSKTCTPAKSTPTHSQCFTTYYKDNKASEDVRSKLSAVAVSRRGFGDTFALDMGESRVLKWSTDVMYRKSIPHRGDELYEVVAGGEGSGCSGDQLRYPEDLAFNGVTGDLFVADTGNNRIVSWRKEHLVANQTRETGYFSSRVVVSGEEKIDGIRIHKPSAITFDHEGNMYVADTGNHRVLRFMAKKDNEEELGESNLPDEPKFPQKEKRGPKKWIMDKAFTAPGPPPSKAAPWYKLEESKLFFNKGSPEQPEWVKGCAKGLSSGNDFRKGEVVAGGRGRGHLNFQLDNPTGVVVDMSGTMYVSDTGNARVLRWAKSRMPNRYLMKGDEVDPYYDPETLPENRVHMADTFNCYEVLDWKPYNRKTAYDTFNPFVNKTSGKRGLLNGWTKMKTPTPSTHAAGQGGKYGDKGFVFKEIAARQGCGMGDFYGKEQAREQSCHYAQCPKGSVISDQDSCSQARDAEGNFFTREQCRRPSQRHSDAWAGRCPCVNAATVRSGEVVIGGPGPLSQKPHQERDMLSPGKLELDGEDQLYVTDTMQKRVTRYTKKELKMGTDGWNGDSKGTVIVAQRSYYQCADVGAWKSYKTAIDKPKDSNGWSRVSVAGKNDWFYGRGTSTECTAYDFGVKGKQAVCQAARCPEGTVASDSITCTGNKPCIFPPENGNNRGDGKAKSDQWPHGCPCVVKQQDTVQPKFDTKGTVFTPMAVAINYHGDLFVSDGSRITRGSQVLRVKNVIAPVGCHTPGVWNSRTSIIRNPVDREQYSPGQYVRHDKMLDVGCMEGYSAVRAHPPMFAGIGKTHIGRMEEPPSFDERMVGQKGAIPLRRLPAPKQNHNEVIPDPPVCTITAHLRTVFNPPVAPAKCKNNGCHLPTLGPHQVYVNPDTSEFMRGISSIPMHSSIQQQCTHGWQASGTMPMQCGEDLDLVPSPDPKAARCKYCRMRCMLKPLRDAKKYLLPFGAQWLQKPKPMIEFRMSRPKCGLNQIRSIAVCDREPRVKVKGVEYSCGCEVAYTQLQLELQKGSRKPGERCNFYDQRKQSSDVIKKLSSYAVAWANACASFASVSIKSAPFKLALKPAAPRGCASVPPAYVAEKQIAGDMATVPRVGTALTALRWVETGAPEQFGTTDFPPCEAYGIGGVAWCYEWADWQMRLAVSDRGNYRCGCPVPYYQVKRAVTLAVNKRCRGIFESRAAHATPMSQHHVEVELSRWMEACVERRGEAKPRQTAIYGPGGKTAWKKVSRQAPKPKVPKVIKSAPKPKTKTKRKRQYVKQVSNLTKASVKLQRKVEAAAEVEDEVIANREEAKTTSLEKGQVPVKGAILLKKKDRAPRHPYVKKLKQALRWLANSTMGLKPTDPVVAALLAKNIRESVHEDEKFFENVTEKSTYHMPLTMKVHRKYKVQIVNAVMKNRLVRQNKIQRAKAIKWAKKKVAERKLKGKKPLSQMGFDELKGHLLEMKQTGQRAAAVKLVANATAGVIEKDDSPVGAKRNATKAGNKSNTAKTSVKGLIKDPAMKRNSELTQKKGSRKPQYKTKVVAEQHASSKKTAAASPEKAKWKIKVKGNEETTKETTKAKGKTDTKTLGESSASIMNRLLHRNGSHKRQLLTSGQDGHYAELSAVPAMASEENLAASLKTMDGLLGSPNGAGSHDSDLGEVDVTPKGKTALKKMEAKANVNSTNVTRATPAPTWNKKAWKKLKKLEKTSVWSLDGAAAILKQEKIAKPPPKGMQDEVDENESVDLEQLRLETLGKMQALAVRNFTTGRATGEKPTLPDGFDWAPVPMGNGTRWPLGVSFDSTKEVGNCHAGFWYGIAYCTKDETRFVSKLPTLGPMTLGFGCEHGQRVKVVLQGTSETMSPNCTRFMLARQQALSKVVREWASKGPALELYEAYNQIMYEQSSKTRKSTSLSMSQLVQPIVINAATAICKVSVEVKSSICTTAPMTSIGIRARKQDVWSNRKVGCGCSGKYVDTEVYGSVTWMANRLPATTQACAKLHVDTLAYVRTQIMTADLPPRKLTYPKSVEGAMLRITPEARAQLEFVAEHIIQAPSKRMHRACSVLLYSKTHRELARREQESMRFVRRAAEVKNKELEHKAYVVKVNEIAHKKQVTNAEKTAKRDADIMERSAKSELMRYEKTAKTAAWLNDLGNLGKKKVKRDRQQLAKAAGQVAAAKARWEEAKVSAFEGKTVVQRREAAEANAKAAAKGKSPSNSDGPSEVHLKAKEAVRQMEAAQRDSASRSVKLAQARKDLILQQAKQGAVKLKLGHVIEQEKQYSVAVNNTKAAEKMYDGALNAAITKAGEARADERKEKAERKKVDDIEKAKKAMVEKSTKADIAAEKAIKRKASSAQDKVRELDRKSAKERAAKRVVAAEKDVKFREMKRKETLEMNEKVAAMQKDRVELLREHQELQMKLGVSSHIGDMQNTMALYSGRLNAITKNIKAIGADSEYERQYSQLGSSLNRPRAPQEGEAEADTPAVAMKATLEGYSSKLAAVEAARGVPVFEVRKGAVLPVREDAAH